MNIIKKTSSKNNNEIILLSGEFCFVEKNLPQQKTILIIGVVHGDEPQGKFLIENYLSLKNQTPKNKLLFIPCLNPDGLDLKTRENANGVDLNRNFPTENHPSLFTLDASPFKPEAETQFVKEILDKFKPDIILTLHAPYKVVNYDGPAEKIAQDISEIIGYPVSDDIGYPTPGSLGTYAGIERNIPIITLELDEEIDVNELVEPVNKIFDYLAELDYPHYVMT